LKQKPKRIKLRDARWYLEGFHTVDAKLGEDIVILKSRIQDYVSSNSPKRPFLAVLCGEPGAGKSSLAHALARYSRCELIESNAAQWTSANDLFRMCESIRDARMAGKTPLAFIDEIDSPSRDRDFYAKLLSPVWDGTYFVDGHIRKLGTPTVFLLAGSGKAWESGKNLTEAAHTGGDAPKLADLISRFSTQPLDIPPLKERASDIVYIVAHQILARFPRVNSAAEGIFNLFTDCKYGARSISSVIEKFGPLKKERFLGTTDLHGHYDDLKLHLSDTPHNWDKAHDPVMIYL
jgi:DNA polymerase III delta prime subunit